MKLEGKKHEKSIALFFAVYSTLSSIISREFILKSPNYGKSFFGWRAFDFTLQSYRKMF